MKRFDPNHYERFLNLRRWFEQVYSVKPIKFPAPRRKRRDHEWPKAA